jgi:hypothetical protein
MVMGWQVPNAELHIFRDSRRRLPAAELTARLRTEFLSLSACAPLPELLHVLLLCGELECALADARVSVAESLAGRRLTELLADAAVRCDSAGDPADGRSLARDGLRILQTTTYSGEVCVGVPEGFAYYALHPLDYADVIARLGLPRRNAIVVGIRTIGTTLSAIVGAKLGELGIAAERTTVRPTGHPYARACEFSSEQRRLIAASLAGGAECIVCDEGPGRSGTSLLSAAEALEREGVPADRIVLLCSHEPNVNELCGHDAARRWQHYRSVATGMTRRLPVDAGACIGGGEWRRHFVAVVEEWPAVWPQMERLMYLSKNGRELFTFEGHGPYGAAARSRNERMSQSGWAPDYLQQAEGFGVQLLPSERLLRQTDLTSDLSGHMAEYCAWRAREFGVAEADAGELENMTRVNLEREVGIVPEGLRLPVERAAICDNRMAPQHWLLAEDGRILKLDAALHGDDHFFPGPCDIAWDLAGVVVEWGLDSSAREFFLTQYQRCSGDNIMPRMESYELAYATFRLAWSRMAAASVTDIDEKDRLLRDGHRHRSVLEGYMMRMGVARRNQSSKAIRAVAAAARPIHDG